MEIVKVLLELLFPMRKGENSTNKVNLTACFSTYSRIFKEGIHVSSVLGEENAEVSFTFDLTRVHNDFVRLWFGH